MDLIPLHTVFWRNLAELLLDHISAFSISERVWIRTGAEEQLALGLEACIEGGGSTTADGGNFTLEDVGGFFDGKSEGAGTEQKRSEEDTGLHDGCWWIEGRMESKRGMEGGFIDAWCI